MPQLFSGVIITRVAIAFVKAHLREKFLMYDFCPFATSLVQDQDAA
jgi:hypothetical protein